MIQFFRRLRRSLLKENRISKYFLYAIGEILLVVIGILIALQVNNWNQEEKDLKLEKKILLNLKTEFIDNINTLELSISKRTLQLNAINNLLFLIDSDNKKLNLTSIDSLIGVSRYIPNFEARSGVIEDVLNSGKLDLIRNEELRKLLSNWYGDLEDLRRKEDGLEGIILSQFNPYLIKNHTLKNSDNFIIEGLWGKNKFIDKSWVDGIPSTLKVLNPSSLLVDSEFESILSLIRLWAISGQITSMQLKDKLENTLLIINKNLSN